MAVYAGYSDPAIQCQCAGSLFSWVATTNPPTRTSTRLIGTGAITTTITSGSTTIVETTEAILTDIFTYTGNNYGADGNDWYGTAQPPCVSLLVLQDSKRNAR
jgi:hypothetical protein